MIGCKCEVCRSADRHDHRLRTSAMIESDTTRIIIDAGPDFRYQMLRAHINSIDAILLTHEHKDHIGGIDDVRAFNYFESKSVALYSTVRVSERIRRDYDYAFGEDRYPGVPDISLHTIDCLEHFTIGDLLITPIKGHHYTLPVTGYRIGDISYLTDFNSIDESEKAKLKGSQILVVNALRHKEHISHFSLAQAIELAREVGAERTLFTHMSHQIGLYAVENPKLPRSMEFAYDTLTVRCNH